VFTATELVTGERMTMEEFLRCWEELPELKNAELIDGVVHVPSPVSLEHRSLNTLIHRGCQAGNNSTWLMLNSARQPVEICPTSTDVDFGPKRKPYQRAGVREYFPGLWLDLAAFWTEDGAKMLAALNAGLASEDHLKFVARLTPAK
jgi:hypothetical protein